MAQTKRYAVTFTATFTTMVDVPSDECLEDTISEYLYTGTIDIPETESVTYVQNTFEVTKTEQLHDVQDQDP